MRKLLCVLVICAFAPSAMAATVTYLIKGSVASLQSFNGGSSLLPFGVAVGDPMSLTLTLSDTGGPAGPAPTAGYADTVQAMSFTVGANALAVPFDSFPLLRRVTVQNDLESGGIFYERYIAEMYSTGSPPLTPEVRTSGLVFFETIGVGASPLLTSTNYGLLPSNWAQFETREISLNFDQLLSSSSAATGRIIGSINEIAVVPLPAAAWLLTSGLLGLLGLFGVGARARRRNLA